MQTSDLCWRSRQPTPGDLHRAMAQAVSVLKALHDIQHGHCNILETWGLWLFWVGSSPVCTFWRQAVWP